MSYVALVLDVVNVWVWWTSNVRYIRLLTLPKLYILGLDPNLFMELLRGSAVHAKYFDWKLPLMSQRTYTPVNFDIQGMAFGDRQIHCYCCLVGIVVVAVAVVADDVGNDVDIDVGVDVGVVGAKKDIDLITEEANKLGMDTRYLHGVQEIVHKAAELTKDNTQQSDMAIVYEAFQKK